MNLDSLNYWMTKKKRAEHERVLWKDYNRELLALDFFFCIQSCELSTAAKNQIKEEDEMSIDNLLNDIPVWIQEQKDHWKSE